MNNNYNTYQQIMDVVADDFAEMDSMVAGSLNSKVQLVMTVSNHVINAGGKRMRPLMSLLAGRICQDSSSDDIKKLAAIVEMLHTATLVHDDVIDASGMRRGIATANATWDNPTAVLVGDYLIARSFNLLVEFENMALLKVFSDGTCDIAEGEVLQLQHQHNPNATEENYLDIIFGKTARLFIMAMEGAAILYNKSEFQPDFRKFATHFGRAFQIIDDVMDYTSSSSEMGKNIGDDIMEGKPTLPIIQALKTLKNNNSPKPTALNYDELRIVVQTGKVDDILPVVETVIASGAIEYCRTRAKEETTLAINALNNIPSTQYQQALVALAQIALARIT